MEFLMNINVNINSIFHVNIRLNYLAPEDDGEYNNECSLHAIPSYNLGSGDEQLKEISQIEVVLGIIHRQIKFMRDTKNLTGVTRSVRRESTVLVDFESSLVAAASHNSTFGGFSYGGWAAVD